MPRVTRALRSVLLEATGKRIRRLPIRLEDHAWRLRPACCPTETPLNLYCRALPSESV
jgi:hypothetical protein